MDTVTDIQEDIPDVRILDLPHFQADQTRDNVHIVFHPVLEFAHKHFLLMNELPEGFLIPNLLGNISENTQQQSITDKGD
jgi:hypothetical protein